MRWQWRRCAGALGPLARERVRGSAGLTLNPPKEAGFGGALGLATASRGPQLRMKPMCAGCHPHSLSCTQPLPCLTPLPAPQGPFLPGYEAVVVPPGAPDFGLQRADHAVFNVHNLMEAVQYLSKACGESRGTGYLAELQQGKGMPSLLSQAAASSPADVSMLALLI